MDQLTRCAAVDLASAGIRCNAVNPGVRDISGCAGVSIHVNQGCSLVIYLSYTSFSFITVLFFDVGGNDGATEARWAQ